MKKNSYRHRSAVDGRFITKKKSKKYPFQTVKERVKSCKRK